MKPIYKLDRSLLEGCEMCRTEWSTASCSEGGAHDFRVDGDSLFYFDECYGWEGIKIKYCPFCGRPLTEEALAELERKIGGNDFSQPPNEPLNLEQLRAMDGEPVYDWMGYEWFVVSEVSDDGVIMTDGTVFDIDEDSVNSAVGRFYRRKPEDGEL